MSVRFDSGAWERQTIPELGLSFAVNRDWPLDTLDLPGGRMIYQRLPGDAGSVFVRYGSAQTINAIVAALGGTVTLSADTPVTLAGAPARRMEMAITTRGGGIFRDDAPSRERAPLVVTRLVLAGFTLDETPVVAGYRLADEERAEYEAVLESILESILITGSRA